MPIRILYGRADVDRSDAVYRRIGEAGAAPGPLFLLVPEQATVQAEVEITRRLGLAGFWNFEVLSPSRLRDRVFSEVGGAARVVIDDRGKCMALRAVLEDAREELTLYRDAGRRAGFVESLSRFLAECKNCGVTPKDLQKVSGSLPEGFLRTKLTDMTLVYERYQQSLQGRFVDDEDAGEALNRRLPDAEFLKDARVWIDGFDVCPPQLCRMIVTLAACVREVTVTALMDEDPIGGALFAPVEMWTKRVADMARERGIEVVREPLLADRVARGPGVRHLERMYDRYPAQAFPGTPPDVDFHMAAHPYEEAERAAVGILALVREQGLRFGDIAVVGDLSVYGALCRRVFARHGIPCYQDDTHQMTQHPLVQLLLSAMDVARFGWRREDVVACLKTGFFDIPEPGVEALENYAMEYPMRGSRWFLTFERPAEDLDTLNEYRERMVRPLRAYTEAAARAKTVRQHTAALWEFLIAIDAYAHMRALVEDWNALERAEDAKVTARVWELTLECFDQLIELCGDTRLPLADYARVLESGFVASRVGILPPSADAVPIVDVTRIKAAGLKALFVLGLNDGVLPGNGGSDGILLGEERRRASKASGLYLGADDRERQDVETLVLYSALTAPACRLSLSLSIAGAQGNALRPSLLWTRIRRMFPGAPVESSVRGAFSARDWFGGAGSAYPLAASLRACADGGEIDPQWWAVWRVLREGDGATLECLRQGLTQRVASPPLSPRTRAILLKRRSDVSRLERFAACPFSYFVRYGLRPVVRHTRTLEAPDVGIMLHNSIQRFSAFVTQAEPDVADWTQADVRREMNRMLADELTRGRENLLEATGRMRGVTRALLSRAERAAWTLMQHWRVGRFRAVGEEIDFGENEAFPGLRIVVGGEEVTLAGRIDRLESSTVNGQRRVRVIDYKSGRPRFEMDELYYGISLQLAVYLAAALGADPEAAPAGMFLYPMQDGFLQTLKRDPLVIAKDRARSTRLRGVSIDDMDVITAMGGDQPELLLPLSITSKGALHKNSMVVAPEDFQMLLGHVGGTIARIVNALLMGVTRISPYEKKQRGACAFCDARGICGFEEALGGRVRRLPPLKMDEVLARIRNGRQV